jgi:mono/diheme cytochrome c family protein
MYRRAIRSLFVATTTLLLLATAACDKPEDKKPADKKAAEVKAPEAPVVPPPVEPPPVGSPVEPPPVEPPADSGAVAADSAAPPADTGEPAAEGGAEKADGGGEDKPPADKPPTEKTEKPEPTAAKIDAKPIFDAKCKSCHGADGKGDTTIGKKVNIPSLAGTKLSKSKIISTTENGVPDTKMKGFKDKLSADEIAAVATYITKL